jgi:hypothetical protein
MDKRIAEILYLQGIGWGVQYGLGTWVLPASQKGCSQAFTVRSYHLYGSHL